MLRAERMAILQKEFYCLLIREKEIASGLQGKRSKIPIHEKVIEKYLRLQQQKMSELGAARLLFIRQKNRMNCLINENKIRTTRDNSRTLDSSDCEDCHNCNCYGTGDDFSELSFDKDFVSVKGDELVHYQGVMSLDDKQVKEKLQGTLRSVSKKDKELQELFTDSEDIKERLEALKSEKESIRKEMERLQKKSNFTKNIKPGMMSEFTSFVDKTRELTEMLQSLKDGYASDQAKLESMRREISYMAHLKRKTEKPVVVAVEPDNPTLQYQGRLSRTGLCPAIRRTPMNNNSSSSNLNKSGANNKKPVFKATLSCQPCRPAGKSESARMCSGANSVVQAHTTPRNPKILMRSTSLNRSVTSSSNNNYRALRNGNASTPRTGISSKAKEPWRKY